MRVRDLKKKSSNRIDTSYLQNLGIQAYGQDNLYPQTLKNIIAASSTAYEWMMCTCYYVKTCPNSME